jgi:hypothetical protein
MSEKKSFLPLPILLSLLTGVVSFLVYRASSPEGLTWSHYGADSPELLTAALTNGVPHPPGYPVYTVLLRWWLSTFVWLVSGTNFPEYGILFSNITVALAVGILAATACFVIPREVAPMPRALATAAVSLAWAFAPIIWGQAVIVEVYALHALLVALLGWVTIVHPKRIWLFALVAGFGVAHHLTFSLLVPASMYLIWSSMGSTRQAFVKVICAGMASATVSAILYARTLIAASASPLSPVNWGFADNFAGLWWLVSGSGYSVYIEALSPMGYMARLGVLSEIVINQYTIVGVVASLIGIVFWLRTWPVMPKFALLWSVPLAAFCVIYLTHDTELYLSPLLWLMSLSAAPALSNWSSQKPPSSSALARLVRPGSSLPILGIIAVTLLAVSRWPSITDLPELDVEEYISTATVTIPPSSIVITARTEETYALWYAAWGSGTLLTRSPGTVLINYHLYQISWYRRLLAKLYPDIVEGCQTVEEIIIKNSARSPIFLTEKIPGLKMGEQVPVGPLWKLVSAKNPPAENLPEN